jgi:hypothetical protein
MRLNHNKKRNTAFLYEVLIKELSVAAIKNDDGRKQKAVKVLKEYFGKGKILDKELDIYKSLHNLSDYEEFTINKILFEAKKQYILLDRRKVYSIQSRLINEINRKFGKDSWDIFVANFKDIATINQILNQKLNPKDQVLLEEKLYSETRKKEEVENQSIQKVDNLAVKKFVERFNDEYTEKLNEGQKTLLSKYITSYQDDGAGLKLYLYEEIDRLKAALKSNIEGSNNKTTSEKLNKVIEKMKNYNTRSIDRGFLSEVMTIQSLVSELIKNGN